MSRTPDEFDPLFAENLRAAYHQHVHVPPTVDQRILAGARSHLAKRSRLRLLARWGAGAAIAAGLAIALWPRVPGTREGAMPPTVVSNLKDINTDGTVDVVDAYLLARRARLGQNINPAWDFNADGAIDRKDADLVALDAVALPKEAVQ